ncbi:hypothetical protein LINPERHAP1_LOCUS14038, partial [Linum perenne]
MGGSANDTRPQLESNPPVAPWFPKERSLPSLELTNLKSLHRPLLIRPPKNVSMLVGKMSQNRQSNASCEHPPTKIPRPILLATLMFPSATHRSPSQNR